jgi:2-polyprenyl-3-methyl-5-hydroxy-6-metoxy-1,4-benzoquinol methylase
VVEDVANPLRDRAADKPMQLAYSELMAKMLDEQGRRRKASKIVAVLRHYLGSEDLSGLRILDVGCSAGFIADELRLTGAQVTGLDIDEPGLEKARSRFGEHVEFILASGDTIPLPSKSMDIVIFNHIYEHVPDPDVVVAEIRRVVKDDGLVYLALGNRLGVMEPHYKLPFLSWLPKPVAHRYVRLAGRADSYYETFRTRRGLRRMFSALQVWDYTYTVLASPEAFCAEDLVPRRLRGMPPAFWRAMTPVLPAYLWVGTPGSRQPAGPELPAAPVKLSG